MVSVMEKDRDVLRFLWFDDVYNKEDPNLIVLRFAHVFFGVSSSSFLLNANIRHHVELFVASHPQLVKVLIESKYVYDIVFRADSEECAFQKYQQLKDLVRAGGFNLRKFVTNLVPLQEKIDEKEGILKSGIEMPPESGEKRVRLIQSQCLAVHRRYVLGNRRFLVSDGAHQVIKLLSDLTALLNLLAILNPRKGI